MAQLKILKKIDKITDTFIARLDVTYEKIIAAIKTTDLADYEAITNLGASRALVEEVLVASGYYEVIADDIRYQQMVAIAQEFYESTYSRDFLYSELTIQELNAMKEAQFVRLNGLTADARDALAQGILDARFAGVALEEIVDTLEKTVSVKLKNYVNTWVDTATTTFWNTTSTKLAEDNGFVLFKYVGVSDRRTRAFCDAHIGEVKTKKEWDKLDNGNLNPVSIYRGGYNCRHILVGVE